MVLRNISYLIGLFSIILPACAGQNDGDLGETPLKISHPDTTLSDTTAPVARNAPSSDAQNTGALQKPPSESAESPQKDDKADDPGRNPAHTDEKGAGKNSAKKNNPPKDAQKKTVKTADIDPIARQVFLNQCFSLCPVEKITVEEPSLAAHYEPQTLGILPLCGPAAQNPDCLDAALSDGAQVLSRDENKLVLFYPTRFESFIDAARERIDMPALEGRWSFVQNRIIPGVSGRHIDVQASTRNFLDAIQNNRTDFSLQIDEQSALSSDISGVRDFAPTHRIGEFRTQFSRAKNRTHNVKLAAHAVDGLFLMPGAEFSYNDWVGERSEERGFKEAPVIEQGQMVEGLGGGACQVSSTIHAAALLAGLDIRERSSHSLPSSYIPKGMDAVVSYPILDLRIRNSFEHPVVLHVTTEDTTLIAQFLSDIPRQSKVLVRREVSALIPFKEIITVDPGLAPGTVKITKYGKVGYRVLRGRITIANDKENFEKLLDDVYQPQDQHVSIAPDVIYPPPEIPPDDDAFAAP